MKTKKTLTSQDFYSLYMDYVLENNANPPSVYAFAKANKFEEQSFYNYFGSFEALEKEIFNAFFENTKKVLSNSEDYISFDARNKLLSFYFTFFENLTANRSFVVYALNNHKNNLKSLSKLATLKSSFSKFINNLDIETITIKEEKLQNFQHKTLQESAWLQLLLILKFWMDDTSASFEKTDIFIEKSINTSFDLLNITPLKSIIDLGKFIFKEKVKPSL